MITRKEIEDNIYDWTYDKIGRDFEFRPYQFEKIVDILENILIKKENHVHIIEAPTGSGKSLIIIIAAGVLSRYYGLTSYILCSDLFLFSQYEKFLKDNPKINFGMLKGQTGNYRCIINGEDMKNADCRMSQVSWNSLFIKEKAIEAGYPCAETCEYVQARKKAINSNVTLMTYQLFLYSMYLNNNSNNKNQVYFKKRDIVFCDECHNIPDIIRNKFTPTFSLKEIDNLLDIYNESQNRSHNLFDNEGMEIHTLYKEDEFKKKLMDLYDKLCDESNSKKEDFDIVRKIYDFLNEIFPTLNTLLNIIGDSKRSGRINKDDLKTFKTINHILNSHCHWEDLVNCIKSINDGYQYLLKTTVIDKNNEKVINISCTKEDWMVYKHLIDQASWKVLLSATVGGQKSYEENTGIRFTKEKESKFEMVPSTFDFSKSPVYFLNRYKMSFKERDASFEALKPMIYNIIRQFAGKHGIIQTGSYEFAQKIMFYAPSDIAGRLIMYNGSREKQNAVLEHQYTDDSILIGPTLVEGIDLPDDLCRFIIILKVPYPNIKDKYVSEKIKLFPLWYNSHTSNLIIQGIGRGVRNKDDYCVTYIMDACFYGLYIATKDQYPKELQERIMIYN